MPDRLPLSVFIIARNEADRISKPINSVKDWVDEVIVVDSGSSDETVSVAESLGANVTFNEWPGYGPQKRFAEDLCRNDWLLNLDADEEITPKLAEEIRALFVAGQHTQNDSWRIMIRDMFAHETAPADWAHGFNQIRLYDRRKGRFADSTVHDTVRPDPGARVGQLKGVMAHRSIRSLSFYVDKYNRYSDMQVADMQKRKRKMSFLRLLFEFPASFMKGYLIRRYWRYGGWGFIMAMSYAHSRFLRVAKAYEAQLPQNKD